MLFDFKKAVVIGETNICIQCVEYLLSKDWKIASVVSDDGVVVEWGRKNFIQVLPFSQLGSIKEVDFYLFSVINPNIIPDQFLGNENILLALNYHDSLLPKYAGVNSTTWAILNGEKKHGVTIHQIKPGIDEGDIVEQAIIDIEENETTISLNLKCSECFLSLFEGVIDKIENGALTFVKQDLVGRTYYGYRYLPENYGVINGIGDSKRIYRIVRGLDFGVGYGNPVATVKVFLNGEFYIVENFNKSLVRGGYAQDNSVLFDVVRDIYGNKADLKIRPEDISKECELTPQALQYLSDIRRTERKYKKQVLDLLGDSEDLMKVFCESGDSGCEQYTQKIKIPGYLDKTKVLVLIYIVLARFFHGKDFVISLYPGASDAPKQLCGLVDKFSFIRINCEMLSQGFSCLENYLEESQKDCYTLTKDFGYRYNLQLLTDIAVFFEEIKQSDKHKIVINLGSDEFSIKGDFVYQAQIDGIVESIKFLFSIENIQKDVVTKDLGYIDIMGHDQYYKIVQGNNQTDKDYPSDKTIHELFEEQVERTPDNIAIVYQDNKLTYQELNGKANQLASYLMQNFDIKPDDMVALYLNRSEHILIAIFGVLKAGGAYVPIDPDCPGERMRCILEDTNAKIILSNEIYKDRLEVVIKKGVYRTKLIMVDSELLWQQLFLQPKANLASKANDRNLAYVIYTSGTAGLPKGVLINHCSYVATINCIRKLYFQKNLNINTCSFTSYTFDIFGSEYGLTLLSGGRILFVNNDLAYIDCSEFDFVQMTPSVCNFRLDYLQNVTSSRLFVTGESLNLGLLRRILAKGVDVVNLYGPTETTIWSTSKPYFSKDCGSIRSVNIGTVLDNERLFVLDENLSLVPMGAIGELCIGGIGLARGYLNRPDLTAEKFIPNPFQTEEEKRKNRNRRLYKTGDLVRWLPDGNLEYMGRNDFQVKIRGYRIELGEIENKLLNYPGIKQAAVIIKKRGTGAEQTADKYLLAYFAADEKLDEDEIYSYLTEQLPEYMLPRSLIYLNKLPLTTNGKLDRKALPEPEFIKRKNYVAPTTELQKQVIDIWSEILNVPKESIGITDSFFSLGGDSIVGIGLTAKLRQKLGLAVSVKDIFDYKTIKKLCDNVLSRKDLQEVKGEIKSEQGLLEGGVSLLPIQEWFFKNNFERAYHWNQAFLIKTPLLDLEKLQSSLDQLIGHHDAFRLRYKRTKEGYVQYYDSKAKVEKLKILDIKALEDQDNFNAVLTEWQSGFNLEKGPMYSVGYIFGYKDGAARIFFAMHHLIVDAVSWRIICEDLQDLYLGKSLGEKGTSYRQWACIVKKYAEENEKEKIYWNNALDGYDKEKDYFNGLVSSDESYNQSKITLDKKQTEKLLRESNKAYNTQINDILLTALGLTLHEITGNNVNHVVLEGHGREDIDSSVDVSRTIGWFTSKYPVKLEVKEGVGESVKYTKEGLRQIPNKGIGYDPLFGVEADNLPQVYFNYLGQFDRLEDKKEKWKIVDEDVGVVRGSIKQNYSILSIDGMAINGVLHFDIGGKLKKNIIAKIANIFKEKLCELIDHIAAQKRTFLTASDIDDVVTQFYLDKLQSDKEIVGVYQANSLQQGFVYHYLNQGDIDDAYITQIIWEYDQPIEVEKLKGAWNLAQKRFGVLRLRFAWEEELVQIIDKNGKLDWRYVDLSKEKDLKVQEDKIGDIREKDRKEPFMLEKGGLFRVYIIKRSKDKCTCVFTSHHAILDGWSNPILLGYIHSVYERLCNREDVGVTVNCCYEDAQKYLRRHQDDDREYWEKYTDKIEERNSLVGFLKNLEKATDISECKYIEKSEELSLKIKGQVYDDLKSICQKEGVTLNAILQYVWHKVLKIYGDSDQTVVGTTVSGRNIPIDNIENSIGLYINTLPLVVDHREKSDQTVLERIKEIQGDVNEINSHSNVRLASLQKEGERLFDSIFVYENYPDYISNKKFDKVNVIFKEIVEESDYPLMVTAHEISDELTFKLKYAGKLFDGYIIEQVLSLIEVLLKQIVSNPCQYERNLYYLDGKQYKDIVYDRNFTEKEYPHNRAIHSLFEEQVERTPDNVALVCQEDKLTYRDLNSRANQLANYLLQNFDIKPNDLVALYLSRRKYMLIAMLGVLKLGGAYVPIDMSCPDERIRCILRDTEAKIILMEYANKGKMCQLAKDTKLLIVDKKEITNCKKTNPVISVTGDDLAYVIYTSGTTGSPKGAMVGHRNLVNFVNHAKQFISKDDVIMSYINYSFDAINAEIYPALLSGNLLYIVEDGLRTNIDDLYRFVMDNSITFIILPAVVATELSLRYDLEGTKLKTMVVGGDVYRGRFDQIRVINQYGPTEATVCAVLRQYMPNDVYANIGKPINNVKCYVVDKNLNILPIGAIGELLIGGEGVARGYLNCPELTAEKFISNPFQAEEEIRQDKNSRLYKTGDLVRWLPDGNLEYIGRNDFQVKIRGYRIELGEVENKLLNYPSIKQVAVMVEERDAGTEQTSYKYLLAYYVADEELDEDRMYSYLAEQLPEYMLPQAFMHLNKLPLTINGKLDRKALPEPGFSKKKNM